MTWQRFERGTSSLGAALSVKHSSGSSHAPALSAGRHVMSVRPCALDAVGNRHLGWFTVRSADAFILKGLKGTVFLDWWSLLCITERLKTLQVVNSLSNGTSSYLKALHFGGCFCHELTVYQASNYLPVSTKLQANFSISGRLRMNCREVAEEWDVHSVAQQQPRTDVRKWNQKQFHPRATGLPPHPTPPWQETGGTLLLRVGLAGHITRMVHTNCVQHFSHTKSTEHTTQTVIRC
jgi:hypothetical protein